MKRSPTPSHHLAKVPLFAGLPRAILDELAAKTPVRRFPEGYILCHEGDQGNDLLVLEEGQFRISRFTTHGREVVLAIVEAPAAVGELALLDAAPRSATITAQRAVIVRLVPRQLFLQMVHCHPVVTEGLLRTLASLVRAGNERHADILGLDAAGRLAKWLLARVAAKGLPSSQGTQLVLDRTQGELAAELGITRVRLNQVLKEFEAKGLLRVERQYIVLLEQDALRLFAS